MKEQIHIDMFQDIDDKHQDSVWYDGTVAELVYKKHGQERRVLILAEGERRIYKRQTGEMVYANGKEIKEGIEGGFKSDSDLRKVGTTMDYIWDCNNWFGILYREGNVDEFKLTEIITGQFNDALKQAKRFIRDDMNWTESEPSAHEIRMKEIMGID